MNAMIRRAALAAAIYGWLWTHAAHGEGNSAALDSRAPDACCNQSAVSVFATTPNLAEISRGQAITSARTINALSKLGASTLERPSNPPSPPPSYGFWDEAFNNPKVRTNYDSAAKGTTLDPLTITGCVFGLCPYYPPIYSASNWASFNLPASSERQYWVLINNNEPANNNGCNSGPPDNSLPNALPGAGLFGFATTTDAANGETFYRAHLVLNANFPNPCWGGIPYMSIGAHSNRGNVDLNGSEKLLGALNATAGVPHSVSFSTRLYEYQAMRAALYRLVVVAMWPDAQGTPRSRMIQLNLFHEGIDDSTGDGPATLRWNWPVAEDTFFPGAEVVYFDAEDVEALCPGYAVKRMTLAERNKELAYSIDLQPLFECASRWAGWSNPMPSTPNLPITSIDWAVEGQSDSGALWVAVHGMHTH